MTAGWHLVFTAACLGFGLQALISMANKRSGSSIMWRKTFLKVSISAAKHPDKLRQLQALFEQEAQRYGVYPLRDARADAVATMRRPIVGWAQQDDLWAHACTAAGTRCD